MRKLFVLTILLLQVFALLAQAPNTWTQKAPNYSVSSGPTGFSINNKAYLGTGTKTGPSGTTYNNDFWEFDPSTNTWSQKANVGGLGRVGAVGFNIGNKGYIGTGANWNIGLVDFWEYDPTLNSWTQKADFGGYPRAYAVGFAIEGKGYIGTGNNPNSNTVGAYQYTRDFWEYNPQNNTWTQKADFGGLNRTYAVGFNIGNRGYIGTGYNGVNNYKDFWEYNPTANTWTQKADFGGIARVYATGCGLGDRGYIGTGFSNLSDFWEYNKNTNSWSQMSNFGGGNSYGGLSLSIGTKVYLGFGATPGGTINSSFWEYSPYNTITPATISPTVYCQGAALSIPFTAAGHYNTGNVFTAQLSNASGSFTSPVTIGTLTSTLLGTITATIPTGTSAGTGYRIRVVSSSPVFTGSTSSSLLTINAIPAAPTASNNSPLCTGGVINLYSTTIQNATYQWTGPNGFTSSAQNPVITNASQSKAGIYSVRVTVNGCASSYSTTNVSVSTATVTPVSGTASPTSISLGTSATLTVSNPQSAF